MKRILLIALAILSLGSVVKAQDGNNTSYFLSNLPQQFRLNPAYQPEYKVFIGLPGLSGVSVNYLNSSFTVEDLLFKRDDSVYMDVNKFYKSLHKRNYIAFNNENSILSIGVKAKSWYGTLDITQKNDFLFRYNKDLFTFLKYGNTDHPSMDFGKLGVNLNSYIEVALGLSKQVNSKLTVGGRLKYLAGIANAHMTDSELDVVTEKDGTMKIHSRQNIRITAPVNIRNEQTGLPFEPNKPIDWDDFDFNTDDIGVADFLNTKNPGFAIDLGGEYQFNDKIKLFASLTDLGFIHWGNKDFRYNFYQDARFTWEGADISNSVNKDNVGYISIDSAFLFQCVGVDCAHCPEKSSKFAEDFRDSGLFAVSERLHGIGQTHARACAVDEKAGKVLPRHCCGSKEHAAEAIEAEPSAPAMVKREACRVVGRDHEADESKQAEAVVQNRGIDLPVAEIAEADVDALADLFQRGASHEAFHQFFLAQCTCLQFHHGFLVQQSVQRGQGGEYLRIAEVFYRLSFLGVNYTANLS